MNRVSEKYEVPQLEYQKKKREKGQKKTGKEVMADSSPPSSAHSTCLTNAS